MIYKTNTASIPYGDRFTATIYHILDTVNQQNKHGIGSNLTYFHHLARELNS